MVGNRLSEADEHLLQLVRSGDADGWSQFVGRFEGRLIAFATGRVDQRATAQDLVQETFVSFLSSVDTFRGDNDLESFLFRILRRRIIDHYRSQGKHAAIPACSFPSADQPASLDTIESAEMQASWYVRQDEQRRADHTALFDAVRLLTEELRTGRRFRDLKIAEGIFYAGRRNSELAAVLSISENEIAVVKHRVLKRLRTFANPADSADSFSSAESSRELPGLREIWEAHRPSCPKRTTLGKYTLGILEPEWDDFVRYHLDTLGCTFCQANLVELRQDEADEGTSTRQQLFQSTVGFLN